MIWLFALLLGAEQAAAAATAASPINDKSVYDPKVLELGFDAFDQNVAIGWRALSFKPGCEEAAANMVRAYRMNAEASLPVLYWHEAQLRAMLGDYAAAIPLMEKSREGPSQDKLGWNAYVAATIAFLRNDQSALTWSRDRLAALPRPSNIPAARKWPFNLEVVDRLKRCFGKTYRMAYGPGCRNPTH